MREDALELFDGYFHAGEVQLSLRSYHWCHVPEVDVSSDLSSSNSKLQTNPAWNHLNNVTTTFVFGYEVQEPWCT